MTMETVDEFMCNYCKKLSAPQDKTELPPGWIRIDLYHGDTQGIAQDGLAGNSNEIEVETHFCQTCRAEVSAQLHALSHRISF
jgi:hypothetical protein